MDEDEAIAVLKQGNIQGLEILVHKFQLRALRAAYLITGDRAQAEDVVQEMFLKAFDRIQQFDETRNFRVWFLKGVVNDAIKAAQRQHTQVSIHADATLQNRALEDLLIDSSIAPEALLESNDLHETVWNALQKLPHHSAP